MISSKQDIMKKVLSLIIPCYNEQEVLELSINTIQKELENIKEDYELIFVNDGSKDRTLEILKEFAAKDKRIKVISLSRNFGQQAAIRAGLENATGDYVGFIDADLQDPPALIPKMIEKIENEGYDVVYGQRQKREGESKFKLMTSALYYKVFNFISDVPTPENVSDFRVITRQVADELIKIKEQNQNLRALIAFIGFKQTGILFERPARAAGETKYTLKKMLKLAEDGIIGFSTKPLRLPIVLTFVSGLVALLTFILTLCGVTMTNVLLSFIFSTYMTFAFGIMAIFGIYLTKLYENSKNRQLYIIGEKINF